MTQPTPAEIIRDWFELVWNEGRLDLVEHYLSPDTVMHGLDESGAHAVGPDNFRRFHARLKTAMPDLRFTMQEIVENGGIAAGRWTATATHTGEGLGVPASGKPIAVSGMTFARFKDGKVVEAWNEWDRLTLALAIGQLAPTAAAQLPASG